MYKYLICIATILGICTVVISCQSLSLPQREYISKEEVSNPQVVASSIPLFLPVLPDISPPISRDNVVKFTKFASLQIPNYDLSTLRYSPTGDKIALNIFNRENSLHNTYVLYQEDIGKSSSLGERDLIYGIDWLNDNTLIRSSRGMIESWNVESQTLLYQSEVAQDVISQLEFSPDKQLLAIASYDRMVYLIQESTGKIVHQFKHNEGVTSISFSPDGKWIATSPIDLHYQIWRIEDGHQIWERKYSNNSAYISFSPDGEFLVTGRYPPLVESLSGDILYEILTISPSGYPVIFTNSGDLLIVSGGGDIFFWDISKKILLRHFAFVQQADDIALSPDGRILAIVFRKAREVQFWGIGE